MSSTLRREISNVGGDWSRMKPLYSMERNKCFSTYSVPWSRIYGVYSTPGVGLERNMCYSGVGTRLCRSCAEVVQKLCRSCAEVVPIACTHCALHCLLPLWVVLLAPTVRCIACAPFEVEIHFISILCHVDGHLKLNVTLNLQEGIQNHEFWLWDGSHSQWLSNQWLYSKKIFNECDWINWIWIWLVISCSVWY